MKGTLSIFTLAALLLFSISAIAADKVVVIPMGSSARGTDGQVQYNDDGNTAGAEVYYDKTTGKLEVSGEVRTVDGSGNNRLWSKGRPGASLLAHTDPNGYCTTSTGINYALSFHYAIWGNAQEVCPIGTWVCSSNDLPTTGSCPIVSLSTYSYLGCDGLSVPSSPVIQTTFPTWIADLDTINSIYAPTEYPHDFTVNGGGLTCASMRVWCCWE